MLKKSFTTIVLVFLALLWTGSVIAQEAGTTKDAYTGQFIKTEIPAGQNIPLNFPENAVLWDNGPLATHPGGGAGGADASALQTALGMGTYGFGMQISAGNSVADDFTVSGGDWNIEEMHFFAYQTGSTTTSTINTIYVQIYDGDPSAGGTVIWGDLATNVYTSSTWTNIYRTLDTDLLASTRPIMDVTVTLGSPLVLSAGTYWIEWQCGGTLASGPWQPPVTILGSTGTGNALQNTTAWAAIVDVGPQDLPFVILGYVGAPCPIDPPTNPNPADGATGVDINLASLSWTNGAGANNVEVWFDGTMIYDGPAVTTYPVPGPLAYSSTYVWKIVGKNDTCSVGGPNWSFTTMDDPTIANVFCDDFTAGLGLWTITNDGGTCVWEIHQATEYTMPGTAVGNVMAADADFCGSSTTTLSTATTTGIDGTMLLTAWLEFDNDWNAIDAADFAMVDVSTDAGATWQNVLTFDVTDVRNTHEVWDMTALVAGYVFDMRFVSIQPGWDWWWAVDNVCVYGNIIPVELTSFAAKVNQGNVTLNWSTATETNNMGFEVQRSNGSEYSVIAFVEGNGTTTEIQNYSFTEKNVPVGSYTYRLKQMDYDGTFEYSDAVEVDIIAPAVYSLSQNYPNPFNPSTKISFTLASDSKVSLTIFDVLGQEVTKLVNGNLAAGNHSYDFDASGINSGVYFYRIDATGVDGTNFSSVKKMMLTK